MILEYFWIDNFRVLNKIGFNFSSERNYYYDIETKELKISSNNSHINSFFGDNISEVTAIVGENGVGKSTLFEFMIRNLANFGNGSITENEDGKFFGVFSNIILIKGFDLISNKEDLEQKGYKIVTAIRKFSKS